MGFWFTDDESGPMGKRSQRKDERKFTAFLSLVFLAILVGVVLICIGSFWPGSQHMVTP